MAYVVESCTCGAQFSISTSFANDAIEAAHDFRRFHQHEGSEDVEQEGE